MKLRDAFVPAVAFGLAVTAPACAEESVTEKARVTGFDHIVDIDIEEKSWQEVEGADFAPNPEEGRITDVRSRRVEAGCKEVGDSLWYDESDDWNCTFSWCSTGEDDPNHCEMQYKTVWDYRERTWNALGTCAVAPEAFELRGTIPRKNEECLAVWEQQRPKDERRLVETPRYLVRATIETDEGPSRNIFVELDPQQWTGLERGDCIEIRGAKKQLSEREFVGTCED